MFEETIIPILGVISGWATAGVMYFLLKKTSSTENILDKLDEIATEITQNVELQKKVYIVGALLGQGIRSGVGMGQKGGKMKFEDIAMAAVAQFLPGILGKFVPQQQQQENVDLLGQNNQG